MRLAAKVVIEELARRGDLVGVSVGGPTGMGESEGPFCLVKGTRRLLDLSFLGPDSSLFQRLGKSSAPASAKPSSTAVTAPTSDHSALSVQAFTGMLGAMEHAQDLEIGDPRSGEKALIIDGILKLLARFTPQFPLFIMLIGSEGVPPEQKHLFEIGPEEAGAGWLGVRSAGHSVWIPDPAELPGHIKRLDGIPLEFGGDGHTVPFRCAVAVPLWEAPSNGEDPSAPVEAGLLFLVARDSIGRDQLLELAERLSRFVTRRWQHQLEVNHRIHVDGLTGAYNRAFFDVQFPLELERARRSEVPLTLVIADLDKFKRINDTYGHQAGDAVLRMVARRLHEELRRIDLICRIGGEEFALILPDTSPEAAQDVMGRLLDSRFVTKVKYDSESIEIPVTFSFGAVTFPAGGADPLELFRKADEALYLSKELGRNRCHFWNSDGDHLQILPSPSGD